MRYMPAKAPPLPADQSARLAFVGERLRLARLRRGRSAESVAAQAGITRVTLARLEGGDGSATLGTLLKVMAALGLDADIDQLAQDDELARKVPATQLPRRRAPTRILIDNYPQLKSIAWHLGADHRELTPEEAFALYERNWRHIEQDRVLPREQALIDSLKASVGHGVMLV